MALRSSESASPLGMDAAMLKRLCNSSNGFSSLSFDALALFARCLASECVVPKGVVAFFACHLLSLNKNLGV